MIMTTVNHFDHDGTELRVYQITPNMPDRYSEPPMSGPIEIMPEA